MAWLLGALPSVIAPDRKIVIVLKMVFNFKCNIKTDYTHFGEFSREKICGQDKKENCKKESN